ncbi:hypothetical protein ACLMJK_006625 [Lecanora helva]
MPNEPSKPSTYWVAVLHADKQPRLDNDAGDWLWIRCHGKIQAQTIRDQYEKRASLGEPWVLKHDAKVLSNLQATMSELDSYRDRIIALEAVRSSDTSRLSSTREPLRPKSNQTLSPTSKQNQTLSLDGAKDKKPSTDPDRQIRSVDASCSENNAAHSQPSQRKMPGGKVSPPHHASSPHNLQTSRQQTPYPPKDLYGPHINNFSPRRTHTPSPAGSAAHQPATTSHKPKVRDTSSASPLNRSGPSAGQRLLSPTQGSRGRMVPGQASDDILKAAWSWFWHTTYEEVRRSDPHLTEGNESKRAHYIALAKGESDPDASTGQLSEINGTPSHQSSKSPAVKQESSVDRKTTASPFTDEPPITSGKLNEQKPRHFQLQALLKDAGPQMLEASVEQGVDILDQLKAPLTDRMKDNPDAEQWIKQIDDLRKQAKKTRTVIGVVGNTGAGKSSVINAMLDEERLVPTNCMRACTAVVTELSYNYEKNPYRAQIEFITSAEWEKELKTLFQDLLDGNGQVSRECANEDTDAGIAYAKIKAVYPHKTKEEIANSNIATMLREVAGILGSSKNIEETDSLMFYRKLQHYVDSKEKSTGKKDKDKDKKKERKEMEFWPLIRVVRIYVKSTALATGAVIVDLPGVHDANAARAAVAEGYMKQCTGLWIVAPINRAVDDKAAKSLLGESFKRQLKMDGGFNSVTFICSKTDDISLEEAQDSLGLDDDMAPD